MKGKLNYIDEGDMNINECNEMNIPVCCFIFEPDADEKYWTWTASNFMPRKEHVSEGMYCLKAKSKDDLIKVINKYVVPLYEIALKKLKTTGELYYWEIDE